MSTTRESAVSQKRLRLAAMAARPPQRPTNKPKVAITGLTARAVREPVGGRSYVVVTIQTSGGVVGVGECGTHPDPATAVARVLEQEPSLVGQDALAAEKVRLALQTSRKPAELAPVQAAVNIALLDILGKVSKTPVYQVLGGPTREKVRGFAHLHGTHEADLALSLGRAKAAGYRAFLVPLQPPEGPTRGRSFYGNARRLLERLRADAGEEADFILDGGRQLTASEAAGLAADLERFHLLWLEEPTRDIQYKALSKITGESATPLGIGRMVVDHSDFQDLLRMDAIDVLRPDIVLQGISQVRKAAALAETYYVAIAPYHRGGPIATAAALHAAASMPNFFIQEVPLPADERDLAMRRELVGRDFEKAAGGFLPLPEGHGLGIELNENAVRRYEVRT